MNKIKFVFRNQIKEIDFDNSPFTPNTTLLQYLRSENASKGTKEGCNEGDCGACSVVLIEKNNGKLTYRAVNSCVMFLPSVHGKQVLTIEDLGKPGNLHPIQEIFVKEHASQCGFCTPGFIMSLFAQKAQKSDSSTEELIEAVEGNLCRCTGYRPIVVAAEDLAQIRDISYFETYTREDLIDKIEKKETIIIKKDDYEYYIPFTLEEAIRLKKEHQDAVISSGGTDLVLTVTKRKIPIRKIIDITMIDEIKGYRIDHRNLCIGAGTKIEDVYQITKTYFPALSEMLGRFGSKQIRNRASIGGNIATASPIGDTLPVLIALKAKLVLSSQNNERIKTIENFILGYRKTDLTPDELIKEVIIPLSDEDTITKSYKISKRTHLDISTVSASFSLKLDNGKVRDIILAYGGMAEMPKRAANTEKFLQGKEWNEKNILEATEILKKEFSPLTDARSSADARTIMAKNLLIKFFEETKN